MTAELRDRIGDPSQIASLRHMRFDSGPAVGERLIEVRNITGLCVNLLPDRCLDLGQVWLKGVPFAWMGQPALPSAKTGATLDTALGGLMATCGYDHIRQPETHGGISYPLHGSMCLQAVETLDVAPAVMGEPFVLRARMERSCANGARYTLERRIEVDYDKPRLRIDDSVETEPGHPIMALYHFNLGHPLIAPDTEVLGFDAARLPRNASVTQCFAATEAADQLVLQRQIGASTLKFALAFDKTTLPFLQIHTRAAPGGNLVCIEPATHDRLPRERTLKGVSQPTNKRFRLEIDLSVEPTTNAVDNLLLT